MTNTAPARAVSLTTNLDHQLEQAPELRNLAYKVIIADGLRGSKIQHRIGLTMFYRSLQTHEAVEILLKQKLVEDAQALARVLIEQGVNCAYMLLVGNKGTAADFVKYPRFWNYIVMQGLKSIDEVRFRKQVSVELENKAQ